MQLTKQSIGVLSALAVLSVIVFNSEGGGDRLEIQAVYDQFDNNRQLSVEDDHTARKLIVELAGNKTLDQRDPDRWAVSVYCFIICFSNIIYPSGLYDNMCCNCYIDCLTTFCNT